MIARKQNKAEYLQLLAEFNHLTIANYYDSIEITALGHFWSAFNAIKKIC